MILNPDTQNRFGALAPRDPLISEDLDIDVELKVTGNVIERQGFGLWVTGENYGGGFQTKNPFKTFDKLEASFSKMYVEHDLEFYG